MSSYILSIDQGTTSTRVCIVNEKGHLIAQAGKAFQQIFPRPGWVEHNPDEIWQTTLWSMGEALKKAKIPGEDIKAIGITNQRETIVVWDRHNHKPIHNAIVWQCRRTQDFCDKLKGSAKMRSMIQKKTGLVIDPYFSGSKLRWILKNVPGAKKRAQQGDILTGTIDSFLLWRLTQGQSHKTDVSNASRTMLMNLQKCEWDTDLLDLFEVPGVILPEIVASNDLMGVTSGLGVLPDGIPVHGMIGDQQAALFGQMALRTGEVKCTFGTGSFILMNTGKKMLRSKSRLLTTLAWQLKGQDPIYALEGGAFICGAAVQWLRDGLKLISKSEEIESLAQQVPDSGGVEFVPALTGLGAPHWEPEARGVICGITRGTQASHIARATLEAMALQNAEIFQAMAHDLGKKSLPVIKVDGGATANNLLMQMQSDYSGFGVVRPQWIETTAMGAAYMAGLGVGLWKSQSELLKIWKEDKSFKPKISKAQRSSRLASWKRAVKRAMP